MERREKAQRTRAVRLMKVDEFRAEIYIFDQAVFGCKTLILVCN